MYRGIQSNIKTNSIGRPRGLVCEVFGLDLGLCVLGLEKILKSLALASTLRSLALLQHWLIVLFRLYGQTILRKVVKSDKFLMTDLTVFCCLRLDYLHYFELCLILMSICVH